MGLASQDKSRLTHAGTRPPGAVPTKRVGVLVPISPLTAVRTVSSAYWQGEVGSLELQHCGGHTSSDLRPTSMAGAVDSALRRGGKACSYS